MDIAVIIGADNSFGISIARKLIALGLRVYGIGNSFSKTTFAHKEFKAITCDLSDVSASREAIEALLGQNKGVSIVVCVNLPADKDSFEASTKDALQKNLIQHLVSPLVLIQAMIPGLKFNAGHCVFVAPEFRAYNNPSFMECMVGGHLSAFSENLFSSMREEGIKVTTLLGASNQQLNEAVSEYNQPESRLNPIAIAESVERILRYEEGNVITQMVVKPQRVVESGKRKLSTVDEYQQIQLPTPEKFPKEQELIATPAPRRTRRKNNFNEKKTLDSSTPSSPKRTHSKEPERTIKKKSRRNSGVTKRTTVAKKQVAARTVDKA